MSGLAVTFEDVGVSYAQSGGVREVLRGVSAHVPPGGIAALLGRSGSGKSTLLNLAAGLSAPTRGRVVMGAPPRVGYVFQDARLLPWLTLRENLALVCPPEYQADIPATLALVGLEGREHDRPGQLSLGMAQRAAVARALVIRPDLLLLDEPCGALDELTAAELRAELGNLLRRRPATTLLVTHHPGEAVQLADRVLVLGGTPTRVAGTLDIDLPRPRDPDDPATLPLLRAVRELLRRADLPTGGPA
ncbi:ABC-type nitrate/sulfonate/bicarbonate transport system ATPase subunit [Deinococcus metalli]|uniref:ABC-type nitrate/sulfonate/bicarbonate transport system ATPase subunit n=1 Tax=Deinococcus metalli TaxID=1141878 RepID=A0A7W8KAY1_9DEIO|nr:ABC transporter ATP-binding protein [Deinococcus metalli]MBB5374922.1 ABC-type nitrate/sulfonate/bicarbonate transport system ATPase subunit [Deinococcus metalli]GHF32696.1 nitrate/sulfonate/bicarbonate ABC transporter ATP-binding protein [Deinococcus metalli]